MSGEGRKLHGSALVVSAGIAQARDAKVPAERPRLRVAGELMDTGKAGLTKCRSSTASPARPSDPI